MTTNQTPSDIASAHRDEWDEERLQDAERTLKEMYIQVRELRSTIPRLVASLATKQPSRIGSPLSKDPAVKFANMREAEVLFRQLGEAARSANAEVKAFREIIEHPDSRKLFEYAAESRSQKPTGITPWRITEDPNWLKKGP